MPKFSSTSVGHGFTETECVVLYIAKCPLLPWDQSPYDLDLDYWLNLFAYRTTRLSRTSMCLQSSFMITQDCFFSMILSMAGILWSTPERSVCCVERLAATCEGAVIVKGSPTVVLCRDTVGGMCGCTENRSGVERMFLLPSDSVVKANWRAS